MGKVDKKINKEYYSVFELLRNRRKKVMQGPDSGPALIYDKSLTISLNNQLC